MLPLMYYNDFLHKHNELDRLIEVEYKNLADREFAKYFLKTNKKLPDNKEIMNVE